MNSIILLLVGAALGAVIYLSIKVSHLQTKISTLQGQMLSLAKSTILNQDVSLDLMEAITPMLKSSIRDEELFRPEELFTNQRTTEL